MNFTLLLNIYYTIYSYMWVVLIFLLFILYINNYSTFLLNTNFKLLNTTIFIKYNFFFFLLSLAGVPPLLGFLNKIFILNILAMTHNILLLWFFIIINTFLLVFYIQQVKYLQSSKKKFIFFKISQKNDLKLTQFFILLQFFNQCAIFFIPSISIFISYNLLCIVK